MSEDIMPLVLFLGLIAVAMLIGAGAMIWSGIANQVEAKHRRQIQRIKAEADATALVEREQRKTLLAIEQAHDKATKSGTVYPFERRGTDG